MVRTQAGYVIAQKGGRVLSVMFPLTIASLPIALDEECVSRVIVNATLDGKDLNAMKVCNMYSICYVAQLWYDVDNICK